MFEGWVVCDFADDTLQSQHGGFESQAQLGFPLGSLLERFLALCNLPSVATVEELTAVEYDEYTWPFAYIFVIHTDVRLTLLQPQFHPYETRCFMVLIENCDDYMLIASFLELVFGLMTTHFYSTEIRRSQAAKVA